MIAPIKISQCSCTNSLTAITKSVIGWQRLVAEHVVENLFELRDDEHEEENHDRDRQRS